MSSEEIGGSKTLLYAGITEYPVLPKCENEQVQSISREGDLAWLAGIIDGEGSLNPSVQNKPSGKNGDRNDYFTPKVRIANTDMRMIKKISEIYVAENLVFFYHFSSMERYKNKKPTWKNQMSIEISSQKSIKKILTFVLPYLVNKKNMAELMIETIDWVQSQPWRGRMSRAGENYCLNPAFHLLMEKINQEKGFHIEPSTTTRKARQIISW